MVCVHRGTDPIEANLLRGLLESEGIPVQITGENLVGAYSGVPKACEVRVLVPGTRRHAAEAVMARYRRDGAEQEPDWLCGACGEANAPAFEICWQCGEGRGAA